MYNKPGIIFLLALVAYCFGAIPTVTFNNGAKIPILGLGTFKAKPKEVLQAVKDAIDIGYRHIDCAYIYGNEKEVGQAISEKIKAGVVKREDLFITTKLWNTFHKPELVEGAFKSSLEALGLQYVDLYLLHWPMGFKENGEASDVDYVDTWLEIEKLYKQGLAKSIGISNFNKKQIERLLKRATVVPVTNQVECHPYLNQKKLIDFCKSQNITITAYSPLGSGSAPAGKPNATKLLDNPKIKAIANKLRKTPAQIIIRYQIQRGVIAIPKSVNKNRLGENFKVFNFKLSASDVAALDSLDIKGRVVTFEEFATHKYYPFLEEY